MVYLKDFVTVKHVVLIPGMVLDYFVDVIVY